MSFDARNLRTPHLKKRLTLLSLAALMLLGAYSSTQATPMYNIQDPNIIHTVYGADKFHTVSDKAKLSFHFSPFFLHTATASEDGGSKVPAGNMLGRWNMYALFFNPNPPVGKTLAGDFQTYNTIQTSFANTGIQHTQYDPLDETKFIPDDPASESGSYQTVGILYEKKGLRGQISFDFAFGLGMVIKGGVADYRQDPTFTIDTNLQEMITDGSGALTNFTTPADAAEINQDLLATRARNALAKELGLSLEEQSKTDLEDVHVNVRWNPQFKVNENGDHIFTFIPHIAVGAWLPLATEQDRTQAFSAPLGNDGFTGLTTECALIFDFPKQIQFSVGGGVTLYNTRELDNYRVPTSEFQVGFIPWTTTVSKQPGNLWHANVSFKADHFIPNFSCYFDYVYTEHSKDKIDLKEQDQARADKFMPQVLIKNSAWKIQNANAGLKIDISENCAIGIALQGTIGGSRTYRPTTVLGSFIATF